MEEGDCLYKLLSVTRLVEGNVKIIFAMIHECDSLVF